MLGIDEINKLKSDNKQLKNDYEVLDACCELQSIKIKELKAENDRLNKILQEIKEIAAIAFAVCDDDCGNANKFKEIIELTKAEEE